MSEPMPGAVPAQQDGEPLEAAGSAEPAEREPYESSQPYGLPQPNGPSQPSQPFQTPHPTQPTRQLPEAAESAPPEQSGKDAEDGGPCPLGLHVEPTGYAPVDARLRRLDDADQLAVSGHLEVYEDVHKGLREALAGLDRPGPGPAPAAPAPPQHFRS